MDTINDMGTSSGLGDSQTNLAGGTEAEKHKEGPIALSIEQQTAKLPSDVFLWAAAGSIVASAALQLTGRREQSNFVGQWAPTFLVLGLYNKIVKVLGSDRVILLIYTDNGALDQPIEEIDIIDLAAAEVGIAFENEMLRRQLSNNKRN